MHVYFGGLRRWGLGLAVLLGAGHPLWAADATAPSSGASAGPVFPSTAVIHTTVDRRPGVQPPISAKFREQLASSPLPVQNAVEVESDPRTVDKPTTNEAAETEYDPELSPVNYLEPQEELRLGQDEPILKDFAAPSEPIEESTENVPVILMPPEPDLRTDIRELPAQLWDDTKSLVTLSNGLSLGLGAGLTAISANNWDSEIRESTAAHPRRWGGFNNVFDVAGHPATAAGLAGALYATSLLTDDVDLHSFSQALIHSLILTNVSSVSLKYAFDTTRPNGEDHGFPSGHTASAFALAAVVEEYHGGLLGAATYVFAGLVAWQRIDDRKHDLSDVLFGMTLGEVIGRSVAKRHRLEAAGFQIGSYSDGETGTTGLSFHRKF
jgi:hypothetical protein